MPAKRQHHVFVLTVVVHQSLNPSKQPSKQLGLQKQRYHVFVLVHQTLKLQKQRYHVFVLTVVMGLQAANQRHL